MSAGTTLYVGNLSYRMNDDEFIDVFQEFGEIQNARILRDKGTSRSRGFGYVTFSSEDDARRAMESRNGTEIQGRQIRVEVSRPQQERQDGGRRGGYGSGYGGGYNRNRYEDDGGRRYDNRSRDGGDRRYDDGGYRQRRDDGRSSYRGRRYGE